MVLVAVVWIAVGCVLAGALVSLDLSLNLFDWRPHVTAGTLFALAVYLGALGGSIALHRFTRGPLPMATAVVVTLSLAACAVVRLPAETVNPGAFLGRSRASPLPYRLALAAALLLPAALLAIRRWKVDASDAWFRKNSRRLVPPFALAALALSASGVIGFRRNDPVRYSEAANLLGGPSGLVVAAQLAITVFSGLLGDKASAEKAASQVPAAADYQRALDEFYGSDRVAPAIKDEVRAACSKDAAAGPARALSCAHQTLAAARARTEERRDLFGWLAFAAAPIGALAFAIGWRARKPAEE
jgi:hypothetical protein